MGKAYKYGENVNTDVIIPARYLNIADPEELAAHAMEDIDKGFAKTVRQGDIIVAGKNFGSGSSREHAPLVLKTIGVKAVVAPTFARIFYRNAFNIGLPILESQEASEKIDAGDEISVDFKSGRIRNKTKKESYQAEPFPEFMTALIENGGLVNYVKRSGGRTDGKTKEQEL
ncbi:MAG: 3-isopropylmalate dehydratase small subunit [Clostridiales Family XIII bacterium]|jgi:3-isopropylmalate/(R)-2-methylmalate dehydratase small subunit|nr:3-isopropylmalate dehydratase small subunit [Clostridiales Family XIII bacterium]